MACATCAVFLLGGSSGGLSTDLASICQLESVALRRVKHTSQFCLSHQRVVFHAVCALFLPKNWQQRLQALVMGTRAQSAHKRRPPVQQEGPTPKWKQAYDDSPRLQYHSSISSLHRISALKAGDAEQQSPQQLPQQPPRLQLQPAGSLSKPAPEDWCR